MKKLLTLGLALASVTLLAGCTNSEPTEEEAVAPVVEEMVVETPVVEEAPVVLDAPVVIEESTGVVAPEAVEATPVVAQ